MRSYRGNGYRVLYDVVRETPPEFPRLPIRAAADVVRAFTSLQSKGLVPTGREVFAVVLLNARHRTIGFHVVSIGTLNNTAVHPREVFRLAVTIGAHAMILAHNHPSGDATPSQEDRRVTDRLTEAGVIIGIEVLDHVVIGDTRYFSFADGRYSHLPGCASAVEVPDPSST